MIKHIVFWNFETEEICKEVVNRLEELPTIINEIVDFEVGENFNGSDAAFQIALYSSFASKDDLQTYQVNPAHKQVAAFIGEVATSRAVVDYEIDE
jgi:hypothetical protein